MTDYTVDNDAFVDAVEKLPKAFDGRVPANDLAFVEDAIDGGEWVEALEQLAAGLGREAQAVSGTERGHLADLFRTAGADLDLVNNLTVRD